MGKLYSKRIIDEIKEKAREGTEIPDFNMESMNIHVSSEFKNNEEILLDLFDHLPVNKQKRIGKQIKVRVIQLMLKEGCWNPELAQKYRVSQEELIEYYHTKKLIREYIKTQTTNSWLEEVARLSKQYWEEENKKAETWRNAERTVLDELASMVLLEKDKIPPRLILKERLTEIELKIQMTNLIIGDLTFKIKHPEYYDPELPSQLLEQKEKKSVLFRDKLLTLHQLHQDKESEQRFVFINAYPQDQSEIRGNEQPIALNINSVYHGFRLLDHFRQWYNSENQQDNSKSQKENKKNSDKAYYNAKQSVISSRDAKSSVQQRAIELKLQGLSLDKISQQLQLEGFKASKSSVQRWLSNK